MAVVDDLDARGPANRYALEFLSEILPDSVVELIPEVVAMQDHLGEMHDAAVAVEMIDDFLSRRRRRSALEGVSSYRRACQTEMEHRLATFPAAWDYFLQRKLRDGFKALLSE